MIRSKYVAGAFSLLLLTNGAATFAQQEANRPTFAPDGTVRVPAFDLPPSEFESPEVLADQKSRAKMPEHPPLAGTDITAVRAALDQYLAPEVAESQRRYPVDIKPGSIAGVKVQTVTPKRGVADKSRVLINLHGGGFTECAEACAMLESIPIAGVGRFKVVTVDYRQAPEFTFPAASEDVAAVYKGLLKTYRPENIGIYGCSAGGSLTAQAAAWFIDKGLPMPGALGIFGSGGMRFGAGDSVHIAAYIDGSFPVPGPGTEPIPSGYFRGADVGSALVSPGAHLDVLAKFPPTILVTGTRAMDMSQAIYTHSQLLKAGVRSQLIVGEGMGHCYIYTSKYPEARDAYDVIVRFFNENLGTKEKRKG